MSSLGELIDIFSKLPSLGLRSANRVIVLYLLKNKEKIIQLLMTTIENVRSELSYCHLCGNVDVINPCNICADDKRKNGKLCIVEDIEVISNRKKQSVQRNLPRFGWCFVSNGRELDLINSTLSHY